MMGITRYTRILALFDQAKPAWTVAEISEALDTSASTLYRLIRELVAEELLESTVESRYRLGPLFVDYYRRVRLTDPLVLSGEKFLRPLLQQIPCPATTILARLYGKTVMCVAEERASDAYFTTSYELGRPMPLLRGATSKAVLSTMPKRQIMSMVAKDDSGTEIDPKALYAELVQIRKVGICETRGHVDKGLIGIAAPVRSSELGINASLSAIIEQHETYEKYRADIYAALTATARLIEGFMDDMSKSVLLAAGAETSITTD
ncbi:IclR family transcriptional regulator [Celeribacter sp. SCSIO 80788]|uniref:IclR family transcriptional regulator n=1 Tax=Celeribacter sp. SCSIO 80788 TaxID=3117013 RepID=UPI003DA24399